MSETQAAYHAGDVPALRRAIVMITDHFLVELLKGLQPGPPRYFQTIAGALPVDARPVRWWLGEDGRFCILVESEAFDEVPEGQPYPELPPVTLRCVVLNHN